MSQQKRRHQARRPEEDKALEEFDQFLSKEFGLSAEGEFAADWNTLGLNVPIPARLDGKDLMKVRNAIHRFLNSYFLAHELPFLWTVGLYRGEVLELAVGPTDPALKWCDGCSRTYQFLTCLNCSS